VRIKIRSLKNKTEKGYATKILRAVSNLVSYI